MSPPNPMANSTFTTRPYITLHGTKDGLQFDAKFPSGQEVATFHVAGNKSAFKITRSIAPSLKPEFVCRGSRSIGAATTTLSFQGCEAGISQEGMLASTSTTIKLPSRELTVEKKGSKEIRFKDGSKVVGEGHFKEARFDVFEQADAITTDMILSCWVAMVLKKRADEKTEKKSEGVAAGLDILSALLG